MKIDYENHKITVLVDGKDFDYKVHNFLNGSCYLYNKIVEATLIIDIRDDYKENNDCRFFGLKKAFSNCENLKTVNILIRNVDGLFNFNPEANIIEKAKCFQHAFNVEKILVVLENTFKESINYHELTRNYITTKNDRKVIGLLNFLKLLTESLIVPYNMYDGRLLIDDLSIDENNFWMNDIYVTIKRTIQGSFNPKASDNTRGAKLFKYISNLETDDDPVSLNIRNVETNEEFVLFEYIPTLNKRSFLKCKESILENNYFPKLNDNYKHNNQEYVYYDVINFITNELNLSKEKAIYKKNTLTLQLDATTYALLLLNINL